MPDRLSFHRQDFARIIVALCGLTTIMVGLLLVSPARARGSEGHDVVAAVARAEFAPAVRAKPDAILAYEFGAEFPAATSPSASWSGSI